MPVPLSPVQKKQSRGTSLGVQCLRLWASTAGGKGSIPGQGTKIPHAVQGGAKKKKNRKSQRQRDQPLFFLLLLSRLDVKMTKNF